MREPASEVLSQRSGDRDDLRRQLAISVGAHVIVIVVLVMGPGSWLGDAEQAEPVAMTIRLGGAQGPGQGGLTSIGGQPVQEVVPAEEAARPQWIQPPADTAPDVVLPEENARRLEPRSEIRTAPDEARGRQLTRGAELRDGTAMVDTGATGMGLGLSTGGLGGNSTEIDVGDFCCPEYLATMMSLIQQRWDPNQQVPGSTVVRFTIRVDGAIDSVQLDRSSGYLALDQSAQRAVLLTGQLPRLPSAFPGDNLTVRLTFEYQQ